MSLIRINENDFLDVDKVNHFFMEENDLICITNSERLVIPLQSRKEVLTALFRNDMSKKMTRQYTSV